MANRDNMHTDPYRFFLEHSEDIYRFVSLQNEYANRSRDYGDGAMTTMTEIHLLVAIHRRPGVTVTELAAQTRRTKGAISQIVKRLEEKGYICRQRLESDRKIAPLYATQTGAALSLAHQQYDERTLSTILDGLLRCCTQTELEGFFAVMDVYNQILTDDLDEEER